MNKIKIGIVGVGNCASSLIQGIEYYSKNPTIEGLITPLIGKYKVNDIQVVCAFDVDERKVGKDISVAVFADPNCTKKLFEVEDKGVVVSMGKTLDGVSEDMKQDFKVSNTIEPALEEVAEKIKKSGAEMLICYLPVGSYEAVRFYANCALTAGVSFINAIPEFVCSDNEWIKKFEEKGLICAGDDIKSQIGATILHRVLTRIIQDRGQVITDTYQLNVGGNTDFKNMLNQSRLQSKRKSKTQAVTSNLENAESIQTRIGPSDFIPHLKDNKVCYINIKGKQFANIPFEIDLKLSVEDSPNSAGVMVDIVRLVKMGIDNGLCGSLEPVNAYYFKSPKTQIRDDVARQMVNNFIKKYER